MRRIISVLTVAAIMTVLVAAPALALKGGVKPFTYGDCVSAAATGNFHLFGSPSPSEFNEMFDPLQAQGGDGTNVGCRNFSPG